MRIRLITALVFLPVITAACDRMPADPFASPELAAITGTAGERPAPLTLSALTYSAIREVHTAHGADAALELVRDLAQVQHRLEDASATDSASVRQLLREEQIRIVLLVHGTAVVERTIEGVTEQTAAVLRRRDALAASGIAVPAFAAELDEIRDLLRRARRATGSAEALDAGTRAAVITDRLRAALAGAARLPSLPDLYDDAASRLGDNPVLEEVQALRTAADDAVRSGDADRAEAAVEAARAAQIRTILSVLGPDAVADVIGWGQDRAQQQSRVLERAAEARDVSRLERMNASAADMLNRAHARLRRGDPAGALHLAAHAVDLLNALEATLTGS